jgi:hypothetical protein
MRKAAVILRRDAPQDGDSNRIAKMQKPVVPLPGPAGFCENLRQIFLSSPVPPVRAGYFPELNGDVLLTSPRPRPAKNSFTNRRPRA